MQMPTSLLIVIALLAGAVGMAAVEISTTLEAEGKGCPLNTPAPNAAQGRCIRP
jgi:hypothetical protein